MSELHTIDPGVSKPWFSVPPGQGRKLGVPRLWLGDILFFSAMTDASVEDMKSEDGIELDSSVRSLTPSVC